MKERIQKILASRGIASRRKCEEIIQAGRVICNGTVCKLGDTADPEYDTLYIDGKPIPKATEYVYIMLHKPKGFVTTLSDEKGRKDVSLLLTDCSTRVFPVGRLDMDSEGLLLCTNDGDLANFIMHPKHIVNKVYRVNVGNYSEASLEMLKEPIYLDGRKIQKPDIKIIHRNSDMAELEITIHEGRNRQVRRMCARAGMKVKRLIRIREGCLELADLQAGKWRYLTEDEILRIKKEFCNFGM